MHGRCFLKLVHNVSAGIFSCGLNTKTLKLEQMEIKGENVNEPLKPQLNIPAVIGSPIQLEPVLAEIEHVNDLGKSKWYEVIYFDENWRSYAGSSTFQDGEKVIKWKYVKDCL